MSNQAPCCNSTFRYPLPYPEIEVICPNEAYACIIMEDYAGAASELTAITQYLYHHLTSDEEQDVADMLLGIAEVEMSHLEMLGEAIVKLGADPQFVEGCPNKQWSGVNVGYGNSLCQRLHLDLAGEYGAIEQYRQHVLEICDPHIKELLERIILDEQVHVDCFKQAIARHCVGSC